MFPAKSKRLSCGVVILNPWRELLLCHVTGQGHWDLPKGGMDPGETPLQTALRETREETGLQLSAQALMDLGRFPYTAKKGLHLFATQLPRLDVSRLTCHSHFVDRLTRRSLPEMDGFDWFAWDRTRELCTPKMAHVLRHNLNLDQVLEALPAPSSFALGRRADR